MISKLPQSCCSLTHHHAPMPTCSRTTSVPFCQTLGKNPYIRPEKPPVRSHWPAVRSASSQGRKLGGRCGPGGRRSGALSYKSGSEVWAPCCVASKAPLHSGKRQAHTQPEEAGPVPSLPPGSWAYSEALFWFFRKRRSKPNLPSQEQHSQGFAVCSGDEDSGRPRYGLAGETQR